MTQVRTLVSIHDVMPDTLDLVRAQLELLATREVHRVTLLVVPGLEWSPAGIAQLRAWQSSGHELAGHGWIHRARHIRGWRHRCYSQLVSRQAAEHLALDADEIRALLRANRKWFETQGLEPPELYVPPAWGLGALPVREYGKIGFSQLETLSGVHDLRSGRLRRIPAVGFEAVSRLQALTLRVNNLLNEGVARLGGLLRLVFHPRDLELLLAAAARRQALRLGPTLLYRELFP
jgi:predicted deacetylase